MLKSSAGVEEVVEETFWQAWRQADRFDPERGTVQSWLLTMARSRVLDRLRSTRRLREDSIDDSPNVEASASAPSPTDPSLAVEQAERKQLVLARAGGSAARAARSTGVGVFRRAQSIRDCLQRTGLPLGTIKTRMRLAMLKLRERLSPLREDAR